MVEMEPVGDGDGGDDDGEMSWCGILRKYSEMCRSANKKENFIRRAKQKNQVVLNVLADFNLI